MNSITQDQEWFNMYWPAFRRHVHELLAWGYEDARRRIGADHKEETITGFIAEAIQERLEATDCPRWCEQYALKENNPVPGAGLTGKDRKVPDFIFEHTVPPRPQYIFEAKRLRPDRKYREAYYFNSGLKRFLTEKYASKYREAGMICYIQCDTRDKWIHRLKEYLNKDQANGNDELRLRSPLRDEQISQAITNEWVSEHVRDGGHEIAIYHITFDCCSSEDVLTDDNR